MGFFGIIFLIGLFYWGKTRYRRYKRKLKNYQSQSQSQTKQMNWFPKQYDASQLYLQPQIKTQLKSQKLNNLLQLLTDLENQLNHEHKVDNSSWTKLWYAYINLSPSANNLNIFDKKIINSIRSLNRLNQLLIKLDALSANKNLRSINWLALNQALLQNDLFTKVNLTLHDLKVGAKDQLFLTSQNPKLVQLRTKDAGYLQTFNDLIDHQIQIVQHQIKQAQVQQKQQQENAMIDKITSAHQFLMKKDKK